MSGRAAVAARGALAALAALAAACAPGPGGAGPEGRSPLRGIVLVTVDGLRADLGDGSGTATPHLERLAAASTVYENAVTPYPSQLTAHLSLVTGLAPAEHGVLPPRHRLASRIPTLAEALLRHGFATAAFTEDGFLTRAFGFGRGFERFAAHPMRGTDDEPAAGGGERVLADALRFLGGLAPGERFFVWAHLRGPAAAADWRALESKRPPPDGLEWVTAGYDDAVARVDGQVGRLRAALAEQPGADRILLAVTAAHGLELYDHGEVGHGRLYPEVARVPLLVHDPRRPAVRRIAAPASLADLAPTLLRLAGVSPPEGLAGRGLPEPGEPGAPVLSASGGWAPQRSVVAPWHGRVLQLLATRLVAEPDGAWFRHELAFDAAGPAIELALVSLARPRAVRVEIDGRPAGELEIGTGWSRHRLELPGALERHRVRLATDGCDVPRDLGLGPDRRCLSIKIDGPPLERLELFDWSADPAARRDLTRHGEPVPPALAALLDADFGPPLARPAYLELTPSIRASLDALGYLER